MANFVFNSFLQGVADGTDYFANGCYATVLSRSLSASDKNTADTSALTSAFAEDSDQNPLSKKIEASSIEIEEATDGNTVVKADYVNYSEGSQITVNGTKGVLISTTTGDDGKNIAYFDFGGDVNVNNSDFRVLFSGGNTAEPPVKGVMIKFKNA